MNNQDTSSNPTPGFDALGLPEPLLQVLEKLGYKEPSEIQAESIPYLLEGRDILGMAQTGTGKTAAFALPIIANLLDAPKQKSPSVLVLAPTRELAQQVAKSFETYAGKTKVRVAAVYGGAAYGPQSSALRSGVDIVVGTPGRIMDHMRRGSLDVSALTTLVLDEADEMLRMGFIDDVEWVLEQTPDNRQIALFSATMPPEIARIASKHLNNPIEVRIKQKTATASTIQQRYVMAHFNQKTPLLRQLLEIEDTDGVMVFVRTKILTSEVADALREAGIAAEALSGDLSQEQREKTVQRLKSGRIDVVVATDVAARGLDVQRISHVINYDIPFDPEAYVHRIGRTGRAGRSGQAILFVTPREKRMLSQIERVTRSPVEPMAMPTVDDINESRIARMAKSLVTRAEQLADDKPNQWLLKTLREKTELDDAELAAALLGELNGGRPLLLDRSEGLRPAEGRPDRKAARRERGDRSPAPPHKGGERPPRKPRDFDAPKVPMERFRIEVGRDHGVKPGNIVGAIANEAGLDSALIGRVKLGDGHSFVELPEGMPKQVFKHLKGVWVCGQKLSIAKADGPDGGEYNGPASPEDAPRDSRPPRAPRPSGDSAKPPAQVRNEGPRISTGKSKPSKKKARRG